MYVFSNTDYLSWITANNAELFESMTKTKLACAMVQASREILAGGGPYGQGDARGTPDEEATEEGGGGVCGFTASGRGVLLRRGGHH